MDILDKARELRARQTKAEGLLWALLRARQLCDLKFRRQHPIAPYIADFACVAHHVIAEIDGGYHDYRSEVDLERQQYLISLGWKVIRFSNEDVLTDVEAVGIAIARQMGLKPVFKKRQGGGSGMRCGIEKRNNG